MFSQEDLQHHPILRHRLLMALPQLPFFFVY
jgi:hypothetical protein